MNTFPIARFVLVLTLPFTTTIGLAQSTSTPSWGGAQLPLKPATPAGAAQELNPQPSPPPKAKLDTPPVIKSLKQTAGMPDTQVVSVNGKTAVLGDLRKGVTRGEFKLSDVSASFKIGYSAAIAELAKAPVELKPLKGMKVPVKHTLPMERWRLVGCSNTEHDELPSVNKCKGSNFEYAKEDAGCVSATLAMGVNLTPVGRGIYCRGSGTGTKGAGAFHTQFNASRQETKAGSDVYEIEYNNQCRYEHWWKTSYGNAQLDASNPRPGVFRVTVRWNANQCISARSSFLGATIDEDFACIASYFNSSTTAECPAGVAP
jgi:hypothetical protein